MKYEKAIKVLETACLSLEGTITGLHKQEKKLVRTRLKLQERSKNCLEAMAKLKNARS